MAKAKQRRSKGTKKPVTKAKENLPNFYDIDPDELANRLGSAAYESDSLTPEEEAEKQAAEEAQAAKPPEQSAEEIAATWNKNKEIDAELYHMDQQIDIDSFKKAYAEHLDNDVKFWTKLAARTLAIQNSLTSTVARLRQEEALDSLVVPFERDVSSIVRLFALQQITTHVGLDAAHFDKVTNRTGGGGGGPIGQKLPAIAASKPK